MRSRMIHPFPYSTRRGPVTTWHTDFWKLQLIINCYMARRSRERQRKCWIENIRNDLEKQHISLQQGSPISGQVWSKPGKSLISLFKWLWLGWKLNSAGHRPYMNKFGDPWYSSKMDCYCKLKILPLNPGKWQHYDRKADHVSFTYTKDNSHYASQSTYGLNITWIPLMPELSSSSSFTSTKMGLNQMITILANASDLIKHNK